MRMKLDHYISLSFRVSNGGKQGGVLSPVLFTIYMDELLERLKRSGLGCYIGHVFAGAFGYADDITLLAPTRSSMVRLLCIAQNFSAEYKFMINSTKSKLIIYAKMVLLMDPSPFAVPCYMHLQRHMSFT